MKVEDVMTRDVITVRPETSLKEVASILAGKGISGVPVVNEASGLVGVVSEGDILFKERPPSSRRRPLAWLLDPYEMEGQLKLEARTAEEAMTSPAKTIAPDRVVGAAAAMMVEAGVNRLPVVDADGRLVGIVTRADLVRAFIRPDEAIEREIKQDLLQTLWIDPAHVSIAVQNGDVRLGGKVDTRDQAELVTRLVQSIPGVVSVDSQLTAPG
ncbi:MAG TPA: CBS domain-containing protein [Gaiellaceae bacterium]